MDYEIILTPISNDDPPPYPTNIKRIEDRDIYRIVEFYGKDDKGKKYEGIFRLKLSSTHQSVPAYYIDHTSINSHTKVEINITGKFDSDAFETFEGEWHEPGGSYNLGIYGM